MSAEPDYVTYSAPPAQRGPRGGGRTTRSPECREGRHGDCNGFRGTKPCHCGCGSWRRGDPRGRHGMVKL